jgi:hypothetical protein
MLPNGIRVLLFYLAQWSYSPKPGIGGHHNRHTLHCCRDRADCERTEIEAGEGSMTSKFELAGILRISLDW